MEEKQIDSSTQLIITEYEHDREFAGKQEVYDGHVALVKRIIDPNDNMDFERINKKRFIIGMKHFYDIIISQDTTPELFFFIIDEKNRQMEDPDYKINLTNKTQSSPFKKTEDDKIVGENHISKLPYEIIAGMIFKHMTLK